MFKNSVKIVCFFTILYSLIIVSCSVNNTTEYYYKVTLRSDSLGTVCNTGEHLCQYNDTLLLSVCSTASGYRFKEWVVYSGIGRVFIGDKNNGSTFITHASGSVVIYPEFTRNSYKITVLSDTLGIVAQRQVREIPAGVKSKIPATAVPLDTAKWMFSHWVIANGNGEITNDSIILESDCVIKPVFMIKMYTVMVQQPSQGGTIVSSPAAGYSYSYGSPLMLTATAINGYHFVNWVGGTVQGLTANPLITTVGTENTFTVVFAPDRYTVSLSHPVYGGTITASPAPGADGKYEYGQNVTVTNVPDIAWKLDTWIVDGVSLSSSQEVTIVIDGNKTVSAKFTVIPGKTGIVYVRKDAKGNNDGTCWFDAFNELYTALNVTTTTGREIWVSKGEYQPEDASKPFSPKADSLKIYGGFNGTEETIVNRKFNEHFSILSGMPGNTIMRIGNKNIIVSGFVFSGTNNTTIGARIEVSGCQIMDCIFKGITSRAIFIQPPDENQPVDSTVIQRTVFHSNSGTSNVYGKCIHITDFVNNTVIMNSVFTNNVGPAITDMNNSGVKATSINNCTVIYNNANSNSTGPGGISSVGNSRLRGNIVYFNTSNAVTGKQIDSTWIVEDCDIQNHATDGIARKNIPQWNSDNVDVDPGFGLSGGTLPADSQWFGPSTEFSFIPNAQSVLQAADYTYSKPTTDIRLLPRGSTFDMGAYEH